MKMSVSVLLVLAMVSVVRGAGIHSLQASILAAKTSETPDEAWANTVEDLAAKRDALPAFLDGKTAAEYASMSYVAFSQLSDAYRQTMWNGVVLPFQTAVKCVMSAWSACTVTCGGGTQTRTQLSGASLGSGAPGCGAADAPTTTFQTCNTAACPIFADCTFSEWTSCPACGAESVRRTRSLLTGVMMSSTATIGGVGCNPAEYNQVAGNSYMSQLCKNVEMTPAYAPCPCVYADWTGCTCGKNTNAQGNNYHMLLSGIRVPTGTWYGTNCLINAADPNTLTLMACAAGEVCRPFLGSRVSYSARSVSLAFSPTYEGRTGMSTPPAVINVHFPAGFALATKYPACLSTNDGSVRAKVTGSIVSTFSRTVAGVPNTNEFPNQIFAVCWDAVNLVAKINFQTPVPATAGWYETVSGSTLINWIPINWEYRLSLDLAAIPAQTVTDPAMFATSLYVPTMWSAATAGAQSMVVAGVTQWNSIKRPFDSVTRT